MAAEDVLIKIAFALSNAKAADRAAARLQKLGVLENIAISRSTVYNKGIKESMFSVEGFGNVSSAKWDEVAKKTNTAVAAINRYKTSAGGTLRVVKTQGQGNVSVWRRIKTAMSDTAMVGERLKKISWSFTMLSMGMLGVFFSMMSFMMLLRKGFDMIAAPLMDIESAATSAAEAFAFNDIIGNDLTETYGELGDVINNQIGAWIGLKALSGELKVGMMGLGAAVFNDRDFILQLSDAIGEFTSKISTPEMIGSIQAIVISMSEMLPVFADMLPILATMLDLFAPILPYFLATAAGAAILMPILSNISALFSIIGSAAQLLGTMMGSNLAINIGTKLAPVVGGLTTMLQGVAVAIAGLLGISVGWLVVIVAVIAAVGILLYKFGIFDGVITRIKSAMSGLADMMGGVVDAITSFDIIGTAGASPVGLGPAGGSTNYTTINVDQTLQVDKMTPEDSESIIDVLSSDFAHQIRGR